MPTKDKLLGVAIVVMITFVFNANVHWSAIVLLFSSASMFGLFILQPFKFRCVKCGHYFSRNVYEYLRKREKRRCYDCACTSQAVDDKGQVLTN